MGNPFEIRVKVDGLTAILADHRGGFGSQPLDDLAPLQDAQSLRIHLHPLSIARSRVHAGGMPVDLPRSPNNYLTGSVEVETIRGSGELSP
ncbi:hypothetical protein D3C86_1611740 [compost metagenome]